MKKMTLHDAISLADAKKKGELEYYSRMGFLANKYRYSNVDQFIHQAKILVTDKQIIFMRNGWNQWNFVKGNHR